MCSRTKRSQSNLPFGGKSARPHFPGGEQAPIQPSGQRARQRLSGFFSIDASLALVIAVFAFASFALLSQAAAASAASQSAAISSSLLAIRFSSYVLESASQRSANAGPGAYYSANELDAERLEAVDLAGVLSSTGKKHAKISLAGAEGELFSKEEGSGGGEIFCAGRLALLSGEIVRLEACIS